jgi:sugar phosphate isomerase/epimerase
MKLAFSTLACPAWGWRDAIARASEYGYDGIEWRLFGSEVITPALGEDQAAEIGREVVAAGLETCALDSGVRLALAAGPERDKQIEDGLAMLRLAAAVQAPLLRLFPGNYPESVSDIQAITWMKRSLDLLIPAAERVGVRLALEVHDSIGWGRMAKRVTSASQITAALAELGGSPQVGVLWDWGNPYLEGETPARGWEWIRERTIFVHAKDMRPRPDLVWEYSLPGEGIMPMKDMMGWLKATGYDGWVSVEWEKKWQPEIPDPEVALPAYYAALRPHLS